MKCSKCGAEYQGNFCPNCGNQNDSSQPNVNTPPKKKSSMKKNIGIVLAVFVVLGVIGSIMGEDESAPTQGSSVPKSSSSSSAPEIKPIVIDAQDLLQAYKDNELAADKEYKDKLLHVTGIVENIGKDVFDDAYITIDNGGPYEIISVQCYLANNDEIDKASTLKSGDTVTIEGVCSGYNLNVILKKAKVVE